MDSSFGYPTIAHNNLPSHGHYTQPYFPQVTTQSFNILQCPRVFPNFAPDRPNHKDFLPQGTGTNILPQNLISKEFHPTANGMPQQQQQQQPQPQDTKPFLPSQIQVSQQQPQQNQGQAQLSQHLQQQVVQQQVQQISQQPQNHIETNGVVVQAQPTATSPKKQKKKGDPNAGKYLLTKEDIEKLNARKMTAAPNVNKSKKFACEICGRSLMTKQALDIHMRSHTGEKPYSCDECGKNFVQQATLNRHRKGVHMPKSQECFECGKMFGYRDYLVKHMRTHTGERPYSCTKCEKTFRDKTSLNQHSRSHK